jgi:hypothetical protein
VRRVAGTVAFSWVVLTKVVFNTVRWPFAYQTAWLNLWWPLEKVNVPAIIFRFKSGLPAVALVGEMVIAGWLTVNFSALDVARGASPMTSHTSTVTLAVTGEAKNFAGKTAVSSVLFRKVVAIEVEAPFAVQTILLTRCAPASKFDPLIDSFKSELPAIVLLGDRDESIRAVLWVSVTLPPEELPPPHPKAAINIVRANAELAMVRAIGLPPSYWRRPLPPSTDWEAAQRVQRQQIWDHDMER